MKTKVQKVTDLLNALESFRNGFSDTAADDVQKALFALMKQTPEEKADSEANDQLKLEV